jgi:hypothetical protein
MRTLSNDLVRQNRIKNIDDKVPAYIALAAHARIRELVESMVVASKHRTGLLLRNFVDRERAMMEEAVAENPLLGEGAGVVVSVDSEPKKTMDEIETRERDAERALRLERGYGGIAGEADESGNIVEAEEAMSGGESGGKKKKKGKRVEISEAARGKSMNQASLMGSKSYSWMGNTAVDPTAIIPRKKPLTGSASGPGPSRNSEATGAAAKAKIKAELEGLQLAATDGRRIMRGMSKRDMYRVSLVDALWAVEGEQSDSRVVVAKWMCKLK